MGNCVIKTFLKVIGRGPGEQADYVMLETSDNYEKDELNDFLAANFQDFGVYKNDIINYQKDTENFKNLLLILPFYKRCKLRYETIKNYKPKCLPHIKSALHVEELKAQKIIETMDIIIIKLLIGEFALGESNMEQLLEKFAVDQSTLCDIEKILNLVNIDTEVSGKFLTEPLPATEDLDALPVMPDAENHELRLDDRPFKIEMACSDQFF
ncbi:tegument protein [Suid betaherpesvirus 2]|uniref:Tegument protein UL51 homolog n=1 Tax=Suid betaherpesvirus 2 TaxID=1608255 RepID=U3GV94_9BETA|nr:tegument protein [Suid betaherpesvirus 2]AGT99238.1 tegument protein [Suid betaherpesvirus 2]